MFSATGKGGELKLFDAAGKAKTRWIIADGALTTTGPR
jgi:hypothetical protein